MTAANGKSGLVTEGERCPGGCRIIALDGEDDFDAERGGYRILTGSVAVGGGTLQSWETCPICDGTGILRSLMKPKHGRNWHYFGERYVLHGRGYIATFCGRRPTTWRLGEPSPNKTICGACALATQGESRPSATPPASTRDGDGFGSKGRS